MAKEIASVLPKPVVNQPDPQAASNVTVSTPPEPFTGAPEEYVLPNGRYAGKKLGDLTTLDPKYLQYLRSSGTEIQKSLAGKMIDAKPAMPAAVPEQAVIAAVADGLDQKTLVGECKALLKQVKEFQGAGIGKEMIPFLKSIGGAKYDYTEWSIGDLSTLKRKLAERLVIK
jgi:hypothetical protein